MIDSSTERTEPQIHAHELLRAGNAPPLEAINWLVDKKHMEYPYPNLHVLSYMRGSGINNIKQARTRAVRGYSGGVMYQIQTRLRQLGFYP